MRAPRAIAICLLASIALAGLSSAARPAEPTVITVTAGKPVEFFFKLSRNSNLRPGPFEFRVTNAGRIDHDFKVCTGGSGNKRAHACAGRGTKLLARGESATLRITLARGTYEYLSTRPGHALAGMQGIIGVGVPAPPRYVPPTGKRSSCCAQSLCRTPQATTVNVVEFDYGFTVTPSTVPCGTVNFVLTNNGPSPHSFRLSLAGSPAFPPLDAGQSATGAMTVSPGLYTYSSEVAGDADRGMVGNFTVTG